MPLTDYPYIEKLGIDSTLKDSNDNPGPVTKIEKFSDIIRFLRTENSEKTAASDSPMNCIIEPFVSRADESNPRYNVTDGGFARPMSAGLWYRGESDSRTRFTPSIFRLRNHKKDGRYIDEKNCFNELKLRLGQRHGIYADDFETLCQLRHYSLPCRLLDWTESPMVALYFALKNAKERRTDALFSVLNVYRLNRITSVLGEDLRPGMIYPNFLDVIIRSAMASHMYIEDVISQTVNKFTNFMDAKTAYILDILNHNRQTSKLDTIIYRSRMPIAVYPNRSDERMIAQSSVFTLHGGKIIYGRDFYVADDVDCSPRHLDGEQYSFIESPIDLDTLNNQEFRSEGGRPFLVHSRISHENVPELLEEFQMLGIDESKLFVNLDSNISAVTHKWSKVLPA